MFEGQSSFGITEDVSDKVTDQNKSNAQCLSFTNLDKI